MLKTAELFRNGRSQAVRLSSECCFEGSEVFVGREPVTGDLIFVATSGVVERFPHVSEGRRCA